MVLKERLFLWRVKRWERRRREILVVFLLEVRK
jgi:hypothetical protein